MERSRKSWFVLVNDFAHDLISGFWVSCIIVLSLLNSKANDSPESSLASALRDVMEFFFWLAISSLGIIVVTGVIRSITYRPETDGGTERLKKKMLIVKHVFLSFVFIGGTVLAYGYAFR